MNTNYTDFLGRPIAKGDEILYPRMGYYGAELVKAKIENIIPLITHRDVIEQDVVFMREDQQDKADPTPFRGKAYKDPSKRYVIQVTKVSYDGTGRLYSLPKSHHIVKVG